MRYLLVIMLLLGGCARPLPPVWTEVPTADALIERLTAAAGRYSSIDASATVSLTNQGKYLSTQQFLLAKRPDLLRTDVLTSFGQVVLQMATDGDNMTVFLNHTVPGRFLYGPASYENLVRFIRIPVRAKDLVSLLLYAPPAIVFDSKDVVAGDNQLVLVLSGERRHQEISFDSQLRIVSSRYYTDDRLQLGVEYDNFSEENSFPDKIKIDVPVQETVVSVSMNEVSLNPKIDPERFQVEPPANVPVEKLF